jgi:hypothetical protein
MVNRGKREATDSLRNHPRTALIGAFPHPRLSGTKVAELLCAGDADGTLMKPQQSLAVSTASRKQRTRWKRTIAVVALATCTAVVRGGADRRSRRGGGLPLVDGALVDADHDVDARRERRGLPVLGDADLLRRYAHRGQRGGWRGVLRPAELEPDRRRVLEHQRHPHAHRVGIGRKPGAGADQPLRCLVRRRVIRPFRVTCSSDRLRMGRRPGRESLRDPQRLGGDRHAGLQRAACPRRDDRSARHRARGRQDREGLHDRQPRQRIASGVSSAAEGGTRGGAHPDSGEGASHHAARVVRRALERTLPTAPSASDSPVRAPAPQPRDRDKIDLNVRICLTRAWRSEHASASPQ